MYRYRLYATRRTIVDLLAKRVLEGAYTWLHMRARTYEVRRCRVTGELVRHVQ